MNLGINIPQMGAPAGAENIVRVAQKAEEMGFATVWTTERLLFPANPRSPYAGTPDGSLPEAYRIVFDPLETLGWAAAHTTKIGIGTSVLDLPYYNPVLLARRVATLDVLSNGRARLGMGLGWSEDEFEAVGADARSRGARADEFLEVLKKIWTTNPVVHAGRFYRIAESFIGPKPVQRPHPPIYLAAYVEKALERAARWSNGWHPAGIPVAGMKAMFEGVRAMAAAAGRDPSQLELIVRANLHVTADPVGGERAIFTGTVEQIAEDVAACREIGAGEVFLDPTFSPGTDRLSSWLELMETFRERLNVG